MTAPVNPRLDNLLASLSLNLAHDGQQALERACGLSGATSTALLALAEFLDGSHVGTLADVLGLTHSGAVRVASQLEDDGLAKRRTGTDRRRVEIRLTAKGRRLASKARAARDAVITDATSDLTVAEARTLEALLARLVSARVTSRLERRRAGDGGAWWCRTCDFAACGRADGHCPAHTIAAQTHQTN